MEVIAKTDHSERDKGEADRFRPFRQPKGRVDYRCGNNAKMEDPSRF